MGWLLSTVSDTGMGGSVATSAGLLNLSFAAAIASITFFNSRAGFLNQSVDQIMTPLKPVLLVKRLGRDTGNLQNLTFRFMSSG